jgi:phosphoserine phosphatase RsbU/P
MSERFRIAVLLDHIESDYHTEILAGALRAARTSPVEILVVPGGRLTASPEGPSPRNFIYDLLLAADERLIVPGGLEREHGTAAVAQLFDERGFTVATLNAIVAVNDDVALGAIEELARRGIMVPDSMSVVGFDDAESARIANPPMTTVNQRVELQAFTAMRSLIDTLESGQALSSVVLQAETVVRMSCGCARHRDASRGGNPARLTLARSCRLALVERRDAVTAEMSRAAAGRIVGMPGWESRLFGALERNLASDDGNFDEVLSGWYDGSSRSDTTMSCSTTC